MRIMTIDVETSTIGQYVDQNTDEICELGFVIADYESKTILTQHSQLFKVNNWSKPAEAIHKIPENVCQQCGQDPSAIPNLSNFIDLNSVSYIIAHNAAYDKTVLSRYWPDIITKNWLCSQHDFLHKKVNVTSKRLNHLAADYEILVPGAHRALRDCLVVLEMAYQNDIKDAWERKNEKRYAIEAHGSYKEGAPQKFKENGWKWNSSAKCWHTVVGRGDLKATVAFVTSIGFTPKASEFKPGY